MRTPQNRGSDTNPYLILNNNGTAVCGAAVIRIRVVVDGDKIHFRGNKHAIADGDASTVERKYNPVVSSIPFDADILA